MLHVNQALLELQGAPILAPLYMPRLTLLRSCLPLGAVLDTFEEANTQDQHALFASSRPVCPQGPC